MRREYDFSHGSRGKHVGRRVRIVGNRTSVNGDDIDVLTDRFLGTREIDVSWVYENTEGFVYRSVPGTVLSNGKALSLRFELTEKNGDDDNFEVIIRRSRESFVLKADHPEMKDCEYLLKEYLGSDELVLFLQDENNRAYFHLR